MNKTSNVTVWKFVLFAIIGALFATGHAEAACGFIAGATLALYAALSIQKQREIELTARVAKATVERIMRGGS